MTDDERHVRRCGGWIFQGMSGGVLEYRRCEWASRPHRTEQQAIAAHEQHVRYEHHVTDYAGEPLAVPAGDQLQ